MALKSEHKVFIKYFLKTGDHIASYLKSFPGTDRKIAATNGKRLLKNKEISAEIERLGGDNHKNAETEAEIHQMNDENGELTPLHKRFCLEFLKDLNASMAVIRSGYKTRNPGQQGYELLKKPEIRMHIQDLMNARAKRTEIDADKVLQELAQIAFAKVTDFLRVETVEVLQEPNDEIGDEEVEEDSDQSTEATPPPIPYKNVSIIDTDLLDPQKIRAIASIKQGRNGIELKLHDKTKALELLGRHLSMWNDKLTMNADEQLVNLYKSVMGAR